MDLTKDQSRTFILDNLAIATHLVSGYYEVVPAELSCYPCPEDPEKSAAEAIANKVWHYLDLFEKEDRWSIACEAITNGLDDLVVFTMCGFSYRSSDEHYFASLDGPIAARLESMKPRIYNRKE